jgi:hypothetical protein
MPSPFLPTLYSPDSSLISSLVLDGPVVVTFNTEVVTTTGPSKTREEIREESGEYKVGRKGEGIGYTKIGGNNTQIEG